MNWVETKNLQKLKLSQIPQLTFDVLRESTIDEVAKGKRLILFFGNEFEMGIRLYIVLADDNKSKLYVSSTKFCNEKSYQSFTKDIPSFHFFEREFFENFGILPEGHPWLKPLRKGIAGISKNETEYEFFKMKGEEVHEVGVGPIHAGIIEPGHFRFSCHGEDVYNLEIQHGFQHKGTEKLFIKNNTLPLYQLKLAESIAGDTVIGHSGTFARALESLSSTIIPMRAVMIRTIALELERIAMHLGDLSGLSTDIGYLTGSSVFSALRTTVINTTMAICGSRFGRSLMALGGVNFDISEELKKQMIENLNILKEKVTLASEVLFSSSSVLARFEKTGIVTKSTAHEIGMVGMAARASGISLDVRADHPFGGFKQFPVHKVTLNSGDVFARAYIRYIDTIQSLKIVLEQLTNLHSCEINTEIQELESDSFVISMAEGWRGEIVHCAITNNEKRICNYKIKDPSFNNWFGLDLAVKGNGISDFPICNKSFDLSYSGMDL